MGQLLCSPVPELYPGQPEPSSCFHSVMSHLWLPEALQGQGYVL